MIHPIGPRNKGSIFLRKIFLVFSRRPTERKTVKNKKLEKLLVKAAASAVFAALIGIVYRQGREAEDDLDTYYENAHGVSKKKLF